MLRGSFEGLLSMLCVLSFCLEPRITDMIIHRGSHKVFDLKTPYSSAHRGSNSHGLVCLLVIDLLLLLLVLLLALVLVLFLRRGTRCTTST